MAAALHAFSGKNVVKRDVDVIVGASNFALLQKAALRQCFQITPDMSLMLPEFLHQAILHPAFQKQIHKSASTSVQKYFNLSALKGWKIVIPPLKHQQLFVEKLSAIKRQRFVYQRSVTELTALFSSLQHRSFRGEL